MVTLHEEIRAILQEQARDMTTQEIADEVNRRGHYLKQDRSPVTSFQIHGRTRQYSQLFTRDGIIVALVERARHAGPVSRGSSGGSRRPRALEPGTSGTSRPVQPASEVKALPPVAGSDARLLILGTMPGAESLRLQQYYADRRNQFWRIVFAAFGQAVPERYEDRVAFLVAHGVALWDVLEDCERDGSLDARIVSGSERPNDIMGFLRGHLEVQAIALNGGRAFTLFQQLIAPSLGELRRSIEIMQMPSTSGAHTVSLATKLLRWRYIFAAAAKPGGAV